MLGAASACTRYSGHATDIGEERFRGSGWRAIHSVPEVRQRGARDCGVAAAQALLLHYAQTDAARRLPEGLQSDPERGVRAGDLRDRLRELGFSAFVFHGTLDDLRYELGQRRPVIVGTLKPTTEQRALSHYEVVVAINDTQQLIVTMDPAHGYRKNSLPAFEREWAGTERITIVAAPRGGAAP